MNKAYKRINWENRPSTATPFNETNMNKMDHALDTRVVEIYNQKDAMASATTNANKAADSANAAATLANTAAFNANEAAQAVLDEKYILTARTEMVRSGTARPTAKGNALLEGLRGDGWQRKLTGKSLVKSTLTNTAINGVTCIDNGDGSYTLNGTATANAWFNLGNVETLGLKVGKRYRLVGCPAGGSNTTYLIRDGYHDMFKETGQGVIFTAYSLNQLPAILICQGTTANNLVFKPMIVDADLYPDVTYDDFEPYCGGVPSPNPSFKQDIRSVGDMGWFDGEWLWGKFINSSGSLASAASCITSANPIPCKVGDELCITHNGELKSSDSITMSIAFYSEDGTFISRPTANDTRILTSAPSGADYFLFDLRNSGNSALPDTAKLTTVTINGKYAAIVDEAKEWFDGELLNGYHDSTDNVISASGRVCNKNPISCSENDKIVLSYEKAVYRMGVVFFNENGNAVDSETVNSTNKLIALVPANTKYCRFYLYDTGLTTQTVGHIHISIDRTSKRIYIPLDEPLMGIGDVKREIVVRGGLYGYLQRVKRFDIGLVAWTRTTSYDNPFFYIGLADKKIGSTVGLCDCLTLDDKNVYSPTSFGANSKNETFCSLATTNQIFVRHDSCVDEEELKNELIGNYIYYELAEPVFTPFADQTPFYNLQSFDEVTHVSIAGLHEELEPTLTMRFPRHEDGALVTTAYCNSKKEAIERKVEMEEIKAAVLALSQS